MVRSSTIISLLSPLCCDNIYPPPLFSFHLEPQELELQLRPRTITNISILPSHKLLQIIVSRLQTPWTLVRYLLHNECICYATNRNAEKTRTVLGEEEKMWIFTRASNEGSRRFHNHRVKVSYSRLSLMIVAPESQFHVYLPWGQCLISIVSQ